MTSEVINASWEITAETPPWAIRTTRDGRRYDVRAGGFRNDLMLDKAPELVVAFADDIDEAPGTRDCLDRARRRKIATELHVGDDVQRTSGAHPTLF